MNDVRGQEKKYKRGKQGRVPRGTAQAQTRFDNRKFISRPEIHTQERADIYDYIDMV